MADPLATQAKPPAQPVDYARMMADLKMKLMHMKRGLLGLRQELRNRSELWEAANEELDMLESMGTEAETKFNNKKAEIRVEKKNARKSKDEDKKDDKPEEGVEEKRTPENEKKDNVEKNEM